MRVSSELGGTVSVINPQKHVVTHQISLEVQGLRGDEIQPVDVQFTADDARAFVALGPANPVAVIDAKKRVCQMASTPDQKYLLTTDEFSNDISVIDVAGLDVVKSVPVGRLPGSVVVSPK